MAWLCPKVRLVVVSAGWQIFYLFIFVPLDRVLKLEQGDS